MPLYSILHSYCKHFYSSWYTLSFWTRYQQFLTIQLLCFKVLTDASVRLVKEFYLPAARAFSFYNYTRLRLIWRVSLPQTFPTIPLLELLCKNATRAVTDRRSGSFKSIKNWSFMKRIALCLTFAVVEPQDSFWKSKNLPKSLDSIFLSSDFGPLRWSFPK